VKLRWAVVGGTWNRDGTIVFAPSIAGPLYAFRILAAVCPRRSLAFLDRQRAESSMASFLPDGQTLLNFVDWSTGR